MDKFKAEHTYLTVLKTLGLDAAELESKTPAQIKQAVKAKVKDTDRSDYERINDSLIVTFAGKPYEIKLKPMSQDFAWRKAVGELVSRYMDTVLADMDPAQEINTTLIVKKAMPVLLGEGVDDLIKLMFLYAPELPEDQIRTKATSIELIDGAMKVFRVAIPFLATVFKNIMQMIPTA